MLVGGPAFADDLVRPPANAPMYQLSNLRIEPGRFGKNIIVFNYRRTRPGKGRVGLAGKTDSGPVTVTFPPSINDESGKVELQSFMGDIRAGIDLELYLVQSYRIDASKSVSLMISNPVRIGNPGQTSSARDLTADEKARHAEYERIMGDDSAHKPSKSYPVTIQPPAGSVFVPATAQVVKGTALQACYNDNWHPIEVISENADGTINVKWVTFPGYLYAMNRGDLVVSNQVLGNLGRHPAGKYAETVPNWASENAKTTLPPSPDAKNRKSYPVTMAIPPGWQTVPNDLKIPGGIPLQACYASQWNPITSLDENQDGTLDVSWDKYGRGFDCSMLRDELIIQDSLAQRLRDDPDSVEIEIKPLTRKNYTVSIPIPRDSQAVPADAVLEPGTKLQACYAGRWNPITFLSHASDGTLNVHWDAYSDAFDCSMTRDQLIIQNTVLSKMSTGQPKESMRWFTDATGRFKVQAAIVDQTDDQVTLLTDKGKRVTLAISKLSQADQEFLRSTKNAVNPFQ